MTDLEKEHMMNGEYNELVEHQRRLDEERDAQVRLFSVLLEIVMG